MSEHGTRIGAGLSTLDDAVDAGRAAAAAAAAGFFCGGEIGPVGRKV